VNDHQRGAAVVVVALALSDEPGTLTRNMVTHRDHRGSPIAGLFPTVTPRGRLRISARSRTSCRVNGWHGSSLSDYFLPTHIEVLSTRKDRALAGGVAGEAARTW